MSEFGKLDTLVNNAAYQETCKTLEEISEDDWDITFKTNIYGYFHVTKAALPHLKSGSSIINCGSITGLEGNKTLIDYASTKGAIQAFTKSLAQNLSDRGIRVTCVAPGPIWTPLQPVSKPAEDVAAHGQDTPMKRPGQPEEVAPAFVFFASNADSSYISGEILVDTASWVGIPIDVAAVALFAARLNGIVAGLMLSLLAAVPCANLIIMGAVYGQANTYFRRSSVVTAPFGARWSDLAKASHVATTSATGPADRATTA